ncbi:MAG: hypothetical protein GY832_18740, partial [Chloroflexi bacterium]|nr:hypothetical protein [Chloroflexota bacterium]
MSRLNITERSLIRRINRRLDGCTLHKARGKRFWSDLGDFYITDDRTNCLLESHVDLDELGPRSEESQEPSCSECGNVFDPGFTCEDAGVPTATEDQTFFFLEQCHDAQAELC